MRSTTERMTSIFIRSRAPVNQPAASHPSRREPPARVPRATPTREVTQAKTAI